ncbi:hypothetical protein FOMPIDRAFT_1023943, partial [Fomitopsis schrenkii]
MTQVRRRFIGKLCRLILSGSLAFAFILIAGDLDLAHRLPQLSKTKYAAGVLFITILLDNIVVWPVVTLIMRRHPDDAKAVFVNAVDNVMADLPAVGQEDIEPDDLCAICRGSLKDVSAGIEASTGEPISVAERGVTKLPGCGHVYCRACLSEWVRRGNGTCPLCNRWFIDALPPNETLQQRNAEWVMDAIEEFRREELARARRRRDRNR